MSDQQSPDRPRGAAQEYDSTDAAQGYTSLECTIPTERAPSSPVVPPSEGSAQKLASIRASIEKLASPHQQESHEDVASRDAHERFAEPVPPASSLSAEQRELIRERVRVRVVLGTHGITTDANLGPSSLTTPREFALASDAIGQLDPSQGDVMGLEDLRRSHPKTRAGSTGEIEPFSTDIKTMDELAAAQESHTIDAFTSAGPEATLRGLPTFFTDASPAELAERRRKLGVWGRVKESLFSKDPLKNLKGGRILMKEQRAAERAAGLALYMASHPVPSATRPAMLTILYGSGHKDTLPGQMRELGLEPEIVVATEG